jgi:ADP-ribose pyrophosphatase YjhB (NUDIX family)
MLIADKYLPGLAVDTVIFGLHDKQLKILILKYLNTRLYALPGGFIGVKEDVHTAARRVLAERTGLEKIFLQQFYTFGDCARYDPAPMRLIMRQHEPNIPEDHFLLRRFVSVGYYALVDFTRVIPRPDKLSDSCEWYDLENLPPLMQDHRQIVEKALGILRANLDRELIAFNLLPERFTIPELQLAYETILGETLNRSSFQRRMLGLGILKRDEKKFSGGAHKAPYLYSFSRQVEQKL